MAVVTSADRGTALEIWTADSPSKGYTTPMLWLPTVHVGPARLTLGLVSPTVLNIEQPPPEP